MNDLVAVSAALDQFTALKGWSGSPEDFVVLKAFAARDRDWRDIADVPCAKAMHLTGMRWWFPAVEPAVPTPRLMPFTAVPAGSRCSRCGISCRSPAVSLAAVPNYPLPQFSVNPPPQFGVDPQLRPAVETRSSRSQHPQFPKWWFLQVPRRFLGCSSQLPRAAVRSYPLGRRSRFDPQLEPAVPAVAP